MALMSISPGAKFPAISFSSTILSTARLSSWRNRLSSRFETAACALSRHARSLESGV